jgi:protein arginine N-methyltransferase 1
MYSVKSHGEMIADEPRTSAYVTALRRVVREGSVVVDVGTGAGLFAMLACRFGARRVYAIEPSSAILLARQLAQDNGFASRIEFIQGESFDVTLTERADVLVADLRGRFSLFARHLPAMTDARRRFLAADGVIIPQRDTFWVAPVDAEQLYESYAEPWTRNPFGLDMSSGSAYATNEIAVGRVRPDQLVAPAQCWGEVDFTKVDSPNVRARIDWTLEKRATVHGYLVWFDAHLGPGTSILNGPTSEAPSASYRNLFFPLDRPVQIDTGQRLELEIAATLLGEDYVWRWSSRIAGAVPDGDIKARSSQCSLLSEIMSQHDLAKQAAAFRPNINEAGRAQAKMLALMEEGHTLGDIAERLVRENPRRFNTFKDALTFVGRSSLKFSE